MNTECYLFVFFNFFQQCFILFNVQVFHKILVKLIPNYFILFDAIINGIAFLSSQYVFKRLLWLHCGG